MSDDDIAALASLPTVHMHTFGRMADGSSYYSIYKRVDLHAQQHVASLIVSSPDLRCREIADAVCRVLDDELATRPQEQPHRPSESLYDR